MNLEQLSLIFMEVWMPHLGQLVRMQALLTPLAHVHEVVPQFNVKNIAPTMVSVNFSSPMSLVDACYIEPATLRESFVTKDELWPV